MIKSNDMVMRARYFMTAAHRAVDQKRKYTNEPYEVHPIEVMDTLVTVGGFESEVLQAALLHDVVEDTKVSLDVIVTLFGSKVARLVSELTDISKPSDGSRAERKRIDREHLAAASSEAQTIKLADLISNTKSIVKHDKAFAKVYLEEKEALLAVLTKADPRLILLAHESLDSAKAILKESEDSK
jgi:(p)ppGpp synthase/HD superfamily hydrolase